MRLLAAMLSCLVLSVVCTGPMAADQLKTFRVEDGFRVIKQQPIATGDKIEVIDFFWYGCPFCNELRPKLEAWIKDKPADVQVRRIPALIRDAWAPHVRIFFTLEALGELERLHQEVYVGYHKEELYMSRPEVMTDWAARHGIERSKWNEAYNSPETTRKIEQAKQLTKAYEIEGTPSVVVDGRWLTSSGLTDEVLFVMPVVDHLVKLARAQRAKK